MFQKASPIMCMLDIMATSLEPQSRPRAIEELSGAFNGSPQQNNQGNRTQAFLNKRETSSNVQSACKLFRIQKFVSRTI
jgi:hypothetical protein